MNPEVLAHRHLSNRIVGLAQLMLQCGMFDAAQWFAAAVRGGLFTHFSAEDDEMESDKLDERLAR